MQERHFGHLQRADTAPRGGDGSGRQVPLVVNSVGTGAEDPHLAKVLVVPEYFGGEDETKGIEKLAFIDGIAEGSAGKIEGGSHLGKHSPEKITIYINVERNDFGSQGHA